MPESSPPSNKYTIEEVALHNDESNTWIVLHNKVYDVTKFMFEHPGGEQVILQWAGQDATDSFEDVGHSADAREMTNDYFVGELVVDESADIEKELVVEPIEREVQAESWLDILKSPTWSNLLIPVAVSVAIYGSYRALKYLLNF